MKRGFCISAFMLSFLVVTQVFKPMDETNVLTFYAFSLQPIIQPRTSLDPETQTQGDLKEYADIINWAFYAKKYSNTTKDKLQRK